MFYELKSKDGRYIKVEAASPEEARQKVSDWEATQGPQNLGEELRESDSLLKKSAGSIMGAVGLDNPRPPIEIPAAIETTYNKVRSSFPQTENARQQSKDVIERNKPLLDTIPGMAAEVGIQALPLAAMSVATGGIPAVAAGVNAFSKLPKAAKAAAAIGTAGVGGYLLGDPEEKEELGGMSSGVQATFEAGKAGLPKAVQFAGKAGSKGMDLAAQKLAEVLKTYKPFEITLDQAAQRLQELVPEIKIPYGSGAKNWIVKRAAQIAEYIPMVSAGDTQKFAERTVTRKVFDKAEGMDAPQRVPPSRRIDAPTEPDLFTPEGIKSAAKSLMGITKKSDPEWQEFRKRFTAMDKRVSNQYDEIINKRDFDPRATFENVVQGLAHNVNPRWRNTLNTIIGDLQASINPMTGQVSGSSIGRLKRDLRKLQNREDIKTDDFNAIDTVIRQLDADVSRQLPAEDAAKWAELNSLYPNREVIKKAIADVTLGDVTPTDFYKKLKGVSPEVSMARGTAKNQELIETAEKVLGERKPPVSTSPFALAAVLGSFAIDAGMTTAFMATIRLSRTKIARELAEGKVPDWIATDNEAQKAWAKKFKSMSESDLLKMLDKLTSQPLGTAIGTEQILGEQ